MGEGALGAHFSLGPLPLAPRTTAPEFMFFRISFCSALRRCVLFYACCMTPFTLLKMRSSCNRKLLLHTKPTVLA